MNTPHALLVEGIDALRPILEPAGFSFRQGEIGSGSGGAFAAGAFVRGDRSLEFSVRHGLGLVVYRIGTIQLSHENYLRYSCHWKARRYPNFGGSVAESFAALAYDLTAFFQDFLSGTGSDFNAVAAEVARDPGRFKGFASLGGA